MSRHIIHKQKVTLQIPKREDAHFFQSRISDLLQNELSEKIEATFDKLFPSDKTIRISSLKLDLGNISVQNFEKEFKEKFIKELSENLSAQKDSIDANNAEILNSTQSLVSSLIYFLEKGSLPWYRAADKTADWENELLNALSANEYNYVLDWLRDNHLHQPVIIKRLVLQFSDNLLKKLGSAIAPIESWNLVYKDFALLLRHHLNTRHISRDELWEYIFSSLLTGHANVKSAILTEDDLLQTLKTSTAKNLIKDTAAIYDNGKELSEGWSRGKVKKWDVTEDALYVTNCGIVLFHSFLRPFFEDLKLFNEGKFVNKKAQQRAVLLLYYLATGETRVAEFDLSLQKILCGYPLEDTLPAFIKLTEREKEELEKLLDTVIDYWEPLRNTSIEGLRNTFLQREGKLVTKENGWLLTIEQKTVDILLKKLPWGFSTIRLPWMDQILNVDWY